MARKQNQGKWIAEEWERIRASDAWRVHSALEELDFVVRLHMGNFLALKRWTKDVEVGGDHEAVPHILQLWSQDNRQQFEAVLLEANRHLHNFLASASTLVDHTRNHVKRLYNGTAFYDEYKAVTTQRFAQSPLCRFVHLLRNYNLHYQFPFVMGGMSIQCDPPGQVKTVKTQMALRSEALLRWPKWDRYALEYLLASDKEVPIERLSNDYMIAIGDFYDWLRSRELTLQQSVLSRLDDRVEQVQAIEAEFYGAPPTSVTL